MATASCSPPTRRRRRSGIHARTGSQRRRDRRIDFQLLEARPRLRQGQQALDITFPFTATDGDGDAVTSQVVIRVTDDVPYAPEAAQNLIGNGDFSSLTGAQPPAWWGTLASGATGWTLSSGGGDPLRERTRSSLSERLSGPVDAGWFPMLDMAASPGNLAISQTVAAVDDAADLRDYLLRRRSVPGHRSTGSDLGRRGDRHNPPDRRDDVLQLPRSGERRRRRQDLTLREGVPAAIRCPIRTSTKAITAPMSPTCRCCRLSRSSMRIICPVALMTSKPAMSNRHR